MTRSIPNRELFSLVFLVDAANQSFLDGLSEMTGEQKRSRRMIVVVSCIALMFGAAMSVLHNKDMQISQNLRFHGDTALGVVTKKEFTDSGQGRDFCFVTYRFQARRPDQHSGAYNFEARRMVSDSVYDHVSEGQPVTVLYDPDNPETSVLELSVNSPRFPLWVVWLWWLASLGVFARLAWIYTLQRRYASEGILIRGAVVNLARNVLSGQDIVTLQFAFDSPSGKKFQGQVQKTTKVTNLARIPPIARDFESVAILYRSDESFLVL